MWKIHLSLWSAGQLLFSQAAPETTVQGCVCTSVCAATINDLYKCAWCYTEGDCGHNGLGGHYDYCVYPDPPSYKDQTFAEKIDSLWEKITADTAHGSYPPPTSLLTESMQVTFIDQQDILPLFRVKAIHSEGAVCKFKVDITEASPYTGLLGPGPQEGFMRMGSAQPFGSKASDTPIPGFGIKFSRTGVHSGDFVLLQTTFPAPSFNFFQMNFSNHLPYRVPDAEQFVVVKKFEQASQCPLQIGISDLAKYSQSGKIHSPPKFPFKLFFTSGHAVQQPAGIKSVDAMLKEFTEINIGTTVLQMWACGEAKDESEPSSSLERACGKPLFLGNMVTTSECTTSAFGDKHLFFRHTLIEDDWTLEPSYLNQYDAAKNCGRSGDTLTPNGAPTSCQASEGMLEDDANVVV